MLDHGGNVRQAAELYGRPVEQWLDLSTGINPFGWPVPELPPEICRRLPETRDGLEQVAAAYYGCESLLPVAGTQQAIQQLPGLRQPCRVGIMDPTYSEHAKAWSEAGHEVVRLELGVIDETLADLDVLVITRPNNPDGLMIGKERALEWHRQLAEKGGWLVADEAFIDTNPQESLALASPRQGLVVLRSLGKFFGLAGIRCGFVLADAPLLDRLQEQAGPWAVSGPARWIAGQALADRQWQQETISRLERSGKRLNELLTTHGLQPSGGTALFQLVRTPRAAMLFDGLASQGVLTRIFRDISSIRFGLPGSEEEWQRLEEALGNS
ncbi:MAG: threonine-phosphate decarboxylase CobD [Sedimenticola sp.]